MDQQTYQAIMALLLGIDKKADGIIARQDKTNGRIDRLEDRADKADMAVAVLQDCKGDWSLSWRKALLIAVALVVGGALMGTEGVKLIAGLFR